MSGGRYSGQVFAVEVTHMLNGPGFGIEGGYCIMSIKPWTGYLHDYPRVHHLKTWPEHFCSVSEGDKTFEARKNDRDYQIGDILVLQEYEPSDV